MKYEERHRDLRDATENWLQDTYGDAPAWSLVAHPAQHRDVVSVYGEFNRRTSSLVDEVVAAARELRVLLAMKHTERLDNALRKLDEEASK